MRRQQILNNNVNIAKIFKIIKTIKLKKLIFNYK